MDLKSKIGQLLMVGFEGTRLSKEEAHRLSDLRIGGVILFKRNLATPGQIHRLTHDLQKLSSAGQPLLIGIDQEGGRVARLPKPFTHLPAAADLGKTDSVELAYAYGEVLGKELRAVGINVDFAPVLDVLTNPKNPVIGDRSFGTSPTLVSKMGLAVIAALQDQGIVACGKHFPGHGDTSADSHEELPVVGLGKDRIHEIELRPFFHAAENRLKSMMTAHVLYPSLDPDRPATLSEKIIQKILRQEMKFDGVVFSDDLEMKSITSRHSIGEAAVMAISAGVDICLVCHSHTAQAEAAVALLSAVEKGKLNETRIDHSVERILRLKKELAAHFKPLPMQDVAAAVGTRAHRQVVQMIHDKSRASA